MYNSTYLGGYRDVGHKSASPNWRVISVVLEMTPFLPQTTVPVTKTLVCDLLINSGA